MHKIYAGQKCFIATPYGGISVLSRHKRLPWYRSHHAVSHTQMKMWEPAFKGVLSRALQFCYGVHEDDNSLDAAETSSKAARSCYMQDFKEICGFRTFMRTVACIGSKT